ncbi:hypothetical protein ACFYOR_34410 [Streptomyces griseofuscus]|uniref:hypothetical protein n=1 Tax=Streptomyces TaxID=1883 RepID=UPI0018F0DCD9|nr:hypothetical protein [Streptomyces sp. CRPSP2-6A1]MBJ7002724.1 hypothetical protein [Streptomyces sp. CRPSP2-6A1]
MAWDEWEQLKADALARRQNGMRLDSAAGTGTGGAPDLKTNEAGNDTAVKALQDEIPRGTDKAGSHADESSATAVREFSGWQTGSGLKDAHAEWQLQVKNLKARLGQDRAALEGSHQHLQYVDYGVGSRTAQIKAGPHQGHEV